MKTSQPDWQFVANLGDVNPIEHGGLFVYVDRTGVYQPEVARLEISAEVDGEPVQWRLQRFTCEACTFQNGILSDNKFHPDKSVWFDVKGIADCHGMSETELVGMFTSADPCERARAWEAVGTYHGFENLDSYPATLTRADLYRRYRKECY